MFKCETADEHNLGNRPLWDVGRVESPGPEIQTKTLGTVDESLDSTVQSVLWSN